MTDQEWADCNELWSDLRSKNKALKEQLAVKSEQLESLRTIFYEITGSIPSKAPQPMPCEGCRDNKPDEPWEEICSECKRQSRQDLYAHKPESGEKK